MSNELVSELEAISVKMQAYEERSKSLDISEPISRLQTAALQVASAWSCSNIGYHSCVYYRGFEVPPPGVHFSSEWGSGTMGNWDEYSYDAVVQHIYHLANNPDLTSVRALSSEARKAFAEATVSITSIISAFLTQSSDDFLTSMKAKVEKLNRSILTDAQATRIQLPKDSVGSRDSLAISQGVQSAPHQGIIGELVATRSVFSLCADLGECASHVSKHIKRLDMVRTIARSQGRSVFIGHGRSLLWRELKDFIDGRLHLPWEEFNRLPAAGVTNIARLTQMLDSAGIALLILTAEDERTDGKVVARQNVVHEAGLFQGRLGFARAVILLEEGCEEFSNVQGLGHIRFPRGQIRAVFEEIRHVLEREGFLDT